MNNPFNGFPNGPFAFMHPQHPQHPQQGSRFEAGQDQLTGFLLGAKIVKVDHGPRNELILILDKNRGRVIISGHTNIHMEGSTANTDVIDVEARLSNS